MNTTAHPTITVEPGSLNAWLIALRPKSLWIAVVPVFVGTSLAVAETGVVDRSSRFSRCWLRCSCR
jgi:1,4-dihydroxy-2-naphthoate octaprenyltransferase